eukprot:5511280-Prymnesium_polylepis.1
MLSTTALAFLKLKVPEQQKLLVAGIMPYYKLINDADFRESESLTAHLKKPAVRQRKISTFLCGLEVNIKDGDVTTASIEGNFLYFPPRVLVASGSDHDGDGNPTPAITCQDPVDCVQKCKLLERTSSH